MEDVTTSTHYHTKMEDVTTSIHYHTKMEDVTTSIAVQYLDISHGIHFDTT